MDFYQFLENVKNKTNLTPWLTKIKSSPKDPTMYLILADYLEEYGGLHGMVGEFLRKAVEYQQIQNKEEKEKFDNQMMGLRTRIQQEFIKLGIGNEQNPMSSLVKVPKLTQSHGIDYHGKLRWAQMNRSSALKKMSLTLSQDRDRPSMPGWEENPEIKKPQYNNVAIHDLANENVQLFYIFLIAQRIQLDNLVLVGNEKDPCDLYGNLSIDQLYDSLIGRTWSGEDEDDIVLYVPDYQVILPYMRQSWSCCGKYDEDDINQLRQAVEAIQYELRDMNQTRENIWISTQIINGWVELLRNLKPGNCDYYKKELGKIISRFRNQKKSYGIFRRAQET